MSKAQPVNLVHPPTSPAARTTTSPIDYSLRGAHHGGFSVHVHGPVTARLFDLIYDFADVRIVDVDGGGAFLAPESALDLADRVIDILDAHRDIGIIDTADGHSILDWKTTVDLATAIASDKQLAALIAARNTASAA